MSIVCAAIKGNEVAIAADSLSSYGSLKASHGHKENSCKLLEVNDSIVGLVNWCAISTLFEHMIKYERQLFRFSDRMETYDTLLKLHVKMKKDYYLTTNNTGLYTELQTGRYPKPGQDNPYAGLLIYDLETKKTTRVDVGGDLTQYVFNIRFTPDGSDPNAAPRGLSRTRTNHIDFAWPTDGI